MNISSSMVNFTQRLGCDIKALLMGFSQIGSVLGKKKTPSSSSSADIGPATNIGLNLDEALLLYEGKNRIPNTVILE